MSIFYHDPLSCEYTFRYFTDVMSSDDRTEERITKTGNIPIINVDMQFRLSDEDIISHKINQLTEAYDPITIPLFLYEYDVHNGVVDTSANSITGDFSNYTEFVGPGDNVFVNGRIMEIRANASQVMFFTESPIEDGNGLYRIIPAVQLQRLAPANSSLANFDRSRSRITGRVIDFNKSFRVSSDQLEFIQNVPVLNREYVLSSQGQPVTYDQYGKIIDFQDGGKIDVFSKVERASRGGSYTFPAGFNDLEYYTSFLNWTSGRRRSFLFPTFLKDLSFIRFGATRQQLVFKNDGDIVNKWKNEQRLMFLMPSGFQMFGKVASVVNIPDEEAFGAELEEPLYGSETPDIVSFMDVSRLASDTVRIIYTNRGYNVVMSIQSINEGELEVTGPPGVPQRQHDITQHDQGQYA